MPIMLFFHVNFDILIFLKIVLVLFVLVLKQIQNQG